MGLTVKAKEMIRFLEAHGFWLKRTGKHHIMTNGTISFPVSKHPNEELSVGTMRSILYSANLQRDELETWLGRE